MKLSGKWGSACVKPCRIYWFSNGYRSRLRIDRHYGPLARFEQADECKENLDSTRDDEYRLFDVHFSVHARTGALRYRCVSRRLCAQLSADCHIEVGIPRWRRIFETFACVYLHLIRTTCSAHHFTRSRRAICRCVPDGIAILLLGVWDVGSVAVSDVYSISKSC